MLEMHFFLFQTKMKKKCEISNISTSVISVDNVEPFVVDLFATKNKTIIEIVFEKKKKKYLLLLVIFFYSS